MYTEEEKSTLKRGMREYALGMHQEHWGHRKLTPFELLLRDVAQDMAPMYARWTPDSQTIHEAGISLITATDVLLRVCRALEWTEEEKAGLPGWMLDEIKKEEMAAVYERADLATYPEDIGVEA